MYRLAKAALATLLLGAAAPSAGQHTSQFAPPLTLADAVALARSDQPRLLAYESEARASEQEADAARSLPDLRVSAGIENFPIRGDNAFSPVDDDMTCTQSA